MLDFYLPVLVGGGEPDHVAAHALVVVGHRIAYSWDDEEGLTGYSYDGASQLAGLTYSLGQTALGNLTYGYDNGGRRNTVGGSFARTGLPNAMTQTAYNANNQLTTWGTANLFLRLERKHDQRRDAQLHVGCEEPFEPDGPGKHGEFYV